MNAAGSTFTGTELVAALANAPVPVYVVSEDDGVTYGIERVEFFASQVALFVTLPDGESGAEELLRRYLDKEITAAQLKKEAKELLG